MKMKEVCAATGLTERAVRFYVQEGLAAPDAQRRGGRTWLDFSPADVERLKAIATLRRAGFTVEELRAMGLTVPDTVDLLDRLQKDGFNVPLTALTVEQCADTIVQAMRGN